MTDSSPQYRLVDYFFETGFGASKTLQLSDRINTEANDSPSETRVFERIVHGVSSPLSIESGSPYSPEAFGGIFASEKRVKHPLEYKFKPDICIRYPAQDYSDKERFPPYLSMFCFPNDVGFHVSENGPPPATYHSFIITGEMGTKMYGVCVTVYEKLRPDLLLQLDDMICKWRDSYLVPSDLEYIQHLSSQLALYQEKILKIKMGYLDHHDDMMDLNQQLFDAEEKVNLYHDLLIPLKNTILADIEHVYEPKCVGVLSHWPWHDLLKDWLCELIRLATDTSIDDPRSRLLLCNLPIERYIVNLIHEVPLPPPGKLEVAVSIGGLKLYCSRPPVNTISILQNFSMYPIFRALSISHLVSVFELALAERKILFISSTLSILTLAAETLCLLFFPFSWQHILIPVLPASLLGYLQAPMPYIIGVSKEYFDMKSVSELVQSDVAIIDLDDDVVHYKDAPPPLPHREKKKLLSRLSKYAPLATVSLGMQSMGSLNILASKEEKAPRVKQRRLPLSIIEAFPGGKMVPSTADSKSSKPAGILRDEESLVGITTQNPTISSPNSASSTTPGSTVDLAKSDLKPDEASKRTSIASISNLFQRMSKSFNTASPLNPVDASPDTSIENSPVTPFLAPISPSHPSALRFETADLHSYSRKGSIEESKNETSTSSENIAGSNPTSATGSRNELSDKKRATSPFLNFFTKKTPLATSPSLPVEKSSTDSPVDTDSISIISTQSATPTVHSSRTANAIYKRPSRYSASENFLLSDPKKRTAPFRYSHQPSSTVTATPLSPTTYPSVSSHSSESTYPMSTTATQEPLSDSHPQLVSIKRKNGHSFQELIRNDESKSSPLSASVSTNSINDKMSSTWSLSFESSLPILCHFCRLDLRSETRALRCTGCSIHIHMDCQSIVDGKPCTHMFKEKKIQLAFFKVFTSLLRNYRPFLKTAEDKHRMIMESRESQYSFEDGVSLDDSFQEDFFKKNEFLASFDKDTRPFMSHFIETQAFSQFVLERIERPESDFEVLFFDESLKAKRNRSKFKLSKETTPFLQDTSYAISQCIAALEPNMEGINKETSFCNRLFPLQLNSEYLLPPRTIKTLITQSDQQMMKSRTFELVQRAHNASQLKRKQDFSKWMKTKWKHFQKIGGGEVVSLGFLSDEQRRELFEARLKQVSEVIDTYEMAHLSTKTKQEIREAIQTLHSQNIVLMKTADEEQLVDRSDQNDLQKIYIRLFRVITIYEDYLATLANTASLYDLFDTTSSITSKSTTQLSLADSDSLGIQPPKPQANI